MTADGGIVRPEDLARELGISAKSLRSWLRRTFPRPESARGADWHLSPEQVEAARTWRSAGPAGETQRVPRSSRRGSGSRADSDEAYVIDLCDELLGEKARRQHGFEWLLGDPGQDGRRRKLPVDAYYPEHSLVVEYQERQHDQPVPYFDKPEVMTVSGVHRGEQRRLYDERRRREIPNHGLRLVVVTPDDLQADGRGRLRRDREKDLPVLRTLVT